MQLVWFGLSSVANGHFVSAIIRMITVLIEMMIVVADEMKPQLRRTHTHTQTLVHCTCIIQRVHDLQLCPLPKATTPNSNTSNTKF